MWKWKVVLGMVRSHPTVVSLHPEAGLIVLVSMLDEVVTVLGMAALRGHMVAALASSSISATAHKENVRLIFFAE